jgi:hypothetical protein
MRRSLLALSLLTATFALYGWSVGASFMSASAPAAPTMGIATALNGGASVTITPPAEAGITSWTVKIWPLRGAGATSTTPFEVTGLSLTSGAVNVPSLVNGTVYQVQVAGVNSSGTGAYSARSNTFTPAVTVVPALDPSITWVLPSWDRLGGTEVSQMAQRLRADIGEGPRAKLGLSMFLGLTMNDWNVNTSSPTAMRAALTAAGVVGAVDAAIASAKAVTDSGGNPAPIPIGFSVLTAIREVTDGVEAGAQAEDLRNAQWYHDWTAPATGDGIARGWMTLSQYARKMRRVKEAYVREFGRLLAERMAQNPGIVVALTGDGEIEMTYDRFRDQGSPSTPANPAPALRSWADYSPFAIAEFRDWIRGKGLYATDPLLQGAAFENASKYQGSDAAALAAFNADYGTAFTTWNLRYYNWTLSTSDSTGASDGTPVTGALSAAETAGGFDAPRPTDRSAILSNTDPFWLLYRRFRSEMVQRYNRDFARWVTEGTALADPSHGGVPYDRWYSAQVPTDVLFGNPPTDGGVRLLTSGSPHWTADISPYGGIGVTGYNVNGGGAGANGNASGFYDRTVPNVAPLMAARSARWAIVEWNPADPWSSSMDSYRADNEVLRRYRPSLLMPYKINNVSCSTAAPGCPEHQWAVFAPAKFVDGLRELMMGQAAVSSTVSHGAIPARNGIAGNNADERGGWLPVITWPTPAPIVQGAKLTTAVQLNATANMAGDFSYDPADGQAMSTVGLQTLTVRFTPRDLAYAVTTATVTIDVRPGGFVSGRITPSNSTLTMPTATIIAKRLGGGEERTTTATDGSYTIGPLQSGTYELFVSAAGFVKKAYEAAKCLGPVSDDCPGKRTANVQPGAPVTFNASLAATGSISGRVTDSLGAGLGGVAVRFLGRGTPNESARTGVTAADGTFVVADVYPNYYTAYAEPPQGYSLRNGMYFDLAEGASATGINFQLSRGGSISGTVNGVLPGQPVQVTAYSANNVAIATVTTSLNYTINGLPFGAYYVKTSGPSTYAHQVYPGRPCNSACNATLGDLVPVALSAPALGINFTLTTGGTIAGAVRATSAAPGASVRDVTIQILSASGAVVKTEPVATDGTYSAIGVPSGDYYVRTTNTARFVDRIYKSGQPGGADCMLCGPASGSPVVVSTGGRAGGIDFDLDRGGAISGTISSAEGTLGGGTVKVFDAANLLVDQPTVGANGVYTTTRGLIAGSYYVQTNNGQGYNDEHYNDNGTVGILPNRTVAVPVTRGQTTPPIDFTLIKGGWVTGEVTGAFGEVLAGVRVSIIHPTTNLEVGFGVTDDNGQYTTSVVPGTATFYYARAAATGGYMAQSFCTSRGSCSASPGAGFGLSNGQATTGINFTLPNGGSILGRVTAQDTSDILQGTVEVYSKDNLLVATAQIEPIGNYQTSPGLTTGDYFVRTRNTSGLPDVLYQRGTDVSTPTLGTRVSVRAGEQTSGIDMVLPTGARIRGTVRDSGNTVLNAATVTFYDEYGNRVSETTSQAGLYASDFLPVGRYTARATAPAYQPEVYLGRDGVLAVPATGQVITITSGVDATDVDFTLVPGAEIAGTVRNSGGTPLDGITVEAYDAAGQLVAETTTQAGAYRFTSGLTGGQSYRLRTRNTVGLIDRRYPAEDCGVCLMTTGTSVSVTNGLLTSGIDFTLSTGATIGGTVTQQADASAVANVTVIVTRFVDGETFTLSERTNSLGQWKTRAGLPAGTYFARTSGTGALGLIDKAWDNQTCQPCNPVTTTAIPVQTSDVTGINLVLARAPGTISGIVRSKTTPTVMAANVRMRLYNSVGTELQENTIMQTDADGRYSFTGLADGRYYVKADPGQGVPYAPKNYNNDSDPEDATLGTAVRIVSGGGGSLEPLELEDGTTAVVVSTRFAIATITETATNRRKRRALEAALAVALNLRVGSSFTVQVDDVLNADSRSALSTAGDVLATFSTSAGQTPRVILDLAPCVVPSFTTTALANAKAGVAYSQLVAASGGTGALRYVVADGSLPPGLSLNATTGAITGTPTASGTGLFTLGAVGTGGCSASREFYLTTTAGDPVNGTATPSSLRFAAVKNGPSGALTGVTGAQTVSVTFSAGASPDWTVTSNQTWLSLSTAGGTGAGAVTASIVNPSNVIGSSASLSATITVTGSGIANGPLTIPVTLTIDQTNGATATLPFGQVDTPTQNAAGVQGAIGVTGWVLDNVGVTGVKIYRNCLVFDNPASCQVLLGFNVVEVGDAAFLAGARPDVEAAFSTFPQNNRAGWGYLMLTSMLPQVTTQQQYGGQGPLTLYAIATDVEGNKRLLGRSSDPASADFAVPTSITMANATIAKPFGAIDTPGQGQTVSGTLNNFGWALTPDSNTTGGEGGDILIPTNGSTMTVFIDSLPVALVAYNQCRGNVGNPVPTGIFCNDDVSNIFGNATPQPVLTTRTANTTLFRNLDAGRAPIGVYSFNTATLTNGLHTIAWSVSDSAGRNEGIGSRFFNVLNSGADQPAADAPAEVLGQARSLANRTVVTSGVYGRTGFDLAASWQAMHADEHGRYTVRLPEMGRLELWLGDAVEAGYLVANDTLRPLPTGSALRTEDATASSVFGWMPPVGYIGDYALSFVRDGERIDVTVTVVPTPAAVAEGVAQIRMNLDEVRSAQCAVRSADVRSAECVVRVDGWAFDPQASVGSGIGAVHVWARKLDLVGLKAGEVAGAQAPFFLGAATVGTPRPDVARAFTDAPSHTGYTLTTPLAAGTYELTAYVWNVRTARWEDARSQTVIVR